MEQKQPKLITKENKLYEYNDGPLLYGYQASRTVQQGFPWISWRGNRLPYDEWAKILAFFLWSQAEHKSEALVRLYYSPEKNDWIVWAPPQNGHNMTVKTLEDHIGMKQAEEFVGYVMVGTGHHHCTTSAFQSGTDAADEGNCNGFHFTVGKLDEAKLDLHVRAVLNGNSVLTHLSHWVDLPERYNKILEDPELADEIPLTVLYDIIMTRKPPKDTPFPEEWKRNYVYGWIGSGSNGVVIGGNYGSSVGFHHGVSSNGRGWVWEAGAKVGKHEADDTPAAFGAKELESRYLSADVELTQLVSSKGITDQLMYRISLVLQGKMRGVEVEYADDVHAILEKHKLSAYWLDTWLKDTEGAWGFNMDV